MEERANGGQARVAGVDAVAARALQLFQIRQDHIAVEGFEGERAGLLAGLLRGKESQQPRGVPVRRDCGWCGVALLGEPLVKERLELAAK